MSIDDIVFDEVTYREPERRRRPDRDRRWACLAYEVPGAGDLPIFLDRATADAIERHALRDTTVELGGILLGKECVDDETGLPYVWITQALEAKHFENTQASFTYTHDSWEEISRERDRQYPDLDIVGWYHTHPDFGIFLSGHDLFIHEHFFAQPLQVAYVVDPIRQTRGFFRWSGGALQQVGGYYLTADRGDRLALARLVNDLEGLPPGADGAGGGGALSPRLEAELIAMLTRPHHQQATSAADQAQLAALFGLMGAVAGGVILALGFWLYSLSHQVQEQTEALKTLNKAVEAAASGPRDKAAADARIEAKEEALNALLAEVRVGNSPERVTKLVTEARQDRAEALRKLMLQTAVYDQFAGNLASLQKEHARVRTELEEANKQLDASKSAKVDREKLKDFEAKNEDQKEKLAAADRRIKDLNDAKSGALIDKYYWTYYAAAGGWGVSLLLGLVLAAHLARGAPPARPDEAPGEPSPHQIV